jgi:hypothetical protein
MYTHPYTGLGFESLGQATPAPMTSTDAAVQQVVRTTVEAVARPVVVLWGLVTLLSIGLSAYHGYRRNRGSMEGAIGWGIAGGVFPVITPVVALMQGFGQPALKKNRKRSKGGSRLKRRSR